MFRLLIWCFAVLCACQPTFAAGRFGWTEFRNDHSGLSLRYPSAILIGPKNSESGADVSFNSSDGNARLLVGTFENTDHLTPRSYQTSIARQYTGLRADYSPVGQNWAVLSGTIGAKMIYEKIMFSCEGRLISTFAMTYPIAERNFYDPIVEVIEDTFRPGRLMCNDTSG